MAITEKIVADKTVGVVVKQFAGRGVSNHSRPQRKGFTMNVSKKLLMLADVQSNNPDAAGR